MLVIASIVIFRDAGRWLVREDSLRPADVIVVLSGGMPWRAEEAGKVFQMGYAPEIWVSQPERPAGLDDLGVRYSGEEDYDREILMHEGVPSTAIHIFPDPIADTEQEVEEIVREMRRQGKTSAIIVTSPEHTRRVRALWRELAGSNPKLIVRGAPQDPFDANHWWRSTRDVFAVVREILGLLNAWTGLPVRPHSR